MARQNEVGELLNRSYENAMGWHGFYINLDRSVARRERMERQFAQLGLAGRYRRFPAIDGKTLSSAAETVSSSEVGIFKSHLTLIRQAAESDSFTHIVEDDVLFSRLVEPCLSDIANGKNSGYDLIVTDTGIHPGLAQYRAFRQIAMAASADRKSGVKLIDFSKGYCWGMTSYMLSPRGAAKLLTELEEEWAQGPQLPVDGVLARAVKAGRIKIGGTFPFVTWLHLDLASQSLAGREQSFRFLETVLQLARYPFYAERDMEKVYVPNLRRLIEMMERVGEDKLNQPSQWALANARTLLTDAGQTTAIPVQE